MKRTFHYILLLAILLFTVGFENIQTVYAAAPSNDVISGARLITGLTYVDTANTTDSLENDTWPASGPAAPARGPCASNGATLNEGYRSLWYKYTPPENQSIQTDTIGSKQIIISTQDLDTYIVVWKKTGGSVATPTLELVGCNDDYLGGVTSRFSFIGIKDTLYYFEVAQYTGDVPDPLSPPEGSSVAANVVFNVNITNTDVTIGETVIQRYYVSASTDERESYTGIDNGPVIIENSTGVPIIASERVAYIPQGSTTQTDYSEIMGIPVDQLESTYWFPVYDNVSRNTALSFGNVGTEPTTITITIGGVVWGTTYDLLPNQSVRPRLAGVDAGPVKVESSGGVPIIVSERFAYTPNGGQTWTGFSETNGLPGSQLRTKYIFSWYNNNKLNTQLRFANAGSATTIVKVTIGGVEKGQYSLAPNKDKRVSYDGLDSGPVIVESLNASVNIIASERVAYIPSGSTTQTSYSEIMGIPVDQLESTYWFPVYDNVSRNTALSFGNVGTEPTTITITIGGVVWGTTYDLLPNQSVRPRLDGVDAGPVKVESSGGVPIIVSERFAYSPNGGVTWPGFSETNGLPDSQLSTSYIFSWYNNNKLNTQVRFAVP